jgi:hypothetical protein
MNARRPFCLALLVGDRARQDSAGAPRRLADRSASPSRSRSTAVRSFRALRYRSRMFSEPASGEQPEARSVASIAGFRPATYNSATDCLDLYSRYGIVAPMRDPKELIERIEPFNSPTPVAVTETGSQPS